MDFRYSLFELCIYISLRSMLNYQPRTTVNPLRFDRRYFALALSMLVYFLFSLVDSLALALSFSFVVNSILEWKLISTSKAGEWKEQLEDRMAHVHVFIHCLLKCQYQYLDRTKCLLLYFVAVYVSFDGKIPNAHIYNGAKHKWMEWFSELRQWNLCTVFSIIITQQLS